MELIDEHVEERSLLFAWSSTDFDLRRIRKGEKDRPRVSRRKGGRRENLAERFEGAQLEGLRRKSNAENASEVDHIGEEQPHLLALEVGEKA